ncbi:MAG: DEAD/DEAH box helicase [Saprospiraceae bacterium]
MVTFRDLNLNSSLLNAINDIGITTPTAIQRKTFSPIMSGDDIVGVAQTGTGKTFAYLLPSLRLWEFTKSPLPQILIMVPTRELVAQVVAEVKKLAIYMNLEVVGVFGGTNIRPQIDAVLAGTDVVVGTPGRLLDLMLKGALKTKKIRRLIIDEVDEMLHQGFRTQLNSIIEFLPKKRQNLMFSATMPEEVEQVINIYTDYYKKIEAAPSGAPLENIEQSAYRAENFNTKANLLELLLYNDIEMAKVLVFVSSRKMADALYERMLLTFEERVGVIHSYKSQNNRFGAVQAFDLGSYRFLIATDLIARGLDVSEVTHVINFDIADVAEKYIHRIGRTGRAEKRGVAISFISEKDLPQKENIEALMDMEIKWKDAPDDLVTSDELIPLEEPVIIIPFNNHKMKQHKPSGEAFHDKSDKNKKINNKVRHETKMQKKYGKQYRKKR